MPTNGEREDEPRRVTVKDSYNTEISSGIYAPQEVVTCSAADALRADLLLGDNITRISL